jgi:signal transduction histidine kinase
MKRAKDKFVVLLLAAVALGLIAEDVAYGYADARTWLPDLATGWTLASCGLLAWWKRPSSSSGRLVAASGFAWFAGNFAHAGLGPIDLMASCALYLHRGLLVHVTQTHPGRRPRGQVDRGMVVVGYAAAILPPVGRSSGATILLGSSLILVTLRRHQLLRSATRRIHVPALLLSLILGGALVVGVVVRQASSPAEATALFIYELALCAFAAEVLASLAWPQQRHRGVSDLVVELGEGRSGTLRDALAHAVQDPTLVVGYRLPGSDSYVDELGRPIGAPEAGVKRRVTPLLHEQGIPVVVVVHDAVVLDDPAFAEAFATATRLTAQHAELQATLRARLEELAASRARLIGAEDAARRSLERELRDGAERRLRGVSELLRRAVTHAAADSATAKGLAEAQLRTAEATGELEALASGLHPRTLSEDGLKRALAELVDRSGLTVRVGTPSQRLPPEVETVVYFVCSEALANVMKHAPLAVVSLTVGVKDADVRVRIADDGPGGADSSRGSGLRGLSDRVESLGGSLSINSPRGGGTELICHLPIEHGGD